MIIRRLVEADAAAFRTLRRHALQESPEAFSSSYEETVTLSLASMAQRLRPDPDAPYDFYLGVFDGDLIGMIGFQRETRLKTRHKGTIRSMYVAAHARCRGVGRALLERAILDVRAQPGLEQLLLAVVSTNEAARRLYTAVGFVVYGVEPRAQRLDGRYLDVDLMILAL